MNIKFGSFIVLTRGTSIQDYQESRNSFAYSDNGVIVYPINNQIPVIVQGSGCIGIATPTRFTVDQNTTRVYFKFRAFDRNSPADMSYAKAYTALYRGLNESDDDSDNADACIPGAMLGNSLSARLKDEARPRVDTSSRFDFEDRETDEFDRILDHVKGKKSNRSL